jgi:hypothetical protein
MVGKNTTCIEKGSMEWRLPMEATKKDTGTEKEERER